MTPRLLFWKHGHRLQSFDRTAPLGPRPRTRARALRGARRARSWKRREFRNAVSNAEGSHQTSRGLFRTADTYVGSNGYSPRLDGLEAGINDRARDRAVVMHGAPYVSEDPVRTVGRLGRSHGCPALRPAIARTVIDTIKRGSLVFAYYPDEQWLRGSRFLNGCS